MERNRVVIFLLPELGTGDHPLAHELALHGARYRINTLIVCPGPSNIGEDAASWARRFSNLPPRVAFDFLADPTGSYAKLMLSDSTPPTVWSEVVQVVQKAFDQVFVVLAQAVVEERVAVMDAADLILWVSRDESPCKLWEAFQQKLADWHIPPSAAQRVMNLPSGSYRRQVAVEALVRMLRENEGVYRVRESLAMHSEQLIEQIKVQVQPQLLETRAPVGMEITQGAIELCLAADSSVGGSTAERSHLVTRVLEEVLGLGPLEQLLKDPEITEIMVNGHRTIFMEKGGKLFPSDITFASEAQLRTAIDRIVGPIGRRVDESAPLCDARLPDGSRVNIVLPPLALDGPSITIRKFSKRNLTMADLVDRHSLSPAMAAALQQAVAGRQNIVVSGGTGSGKTTLLNALSSCIPDDERIVTIEDAAELKLLKPHVVRLESRPPNAEGEGSIPIRRLVINALRMRPDRIVVGECRGGEALDMLQAMNTGHDGSMTTLHANNPRDALGRLETLVLMAGLDLPVRVVREQIRSAVHLIIQQARLPDGSRKIISITEVTGMEGDVLTTQELFRFSRGEFISTGIRSQAKSRIET